MNRKAVQSMIPDAMLQEAIVVASTKSRLISITIGSVNILITAFTITKGCAGCVQTVYHRTA